MHAHHTVFQVESGSFNAQMSAILGMDAALEVDFSGGQIVLKIIPAGERERQLVCSFVGALLSVCLLLSFLSLVQSLSFCRLFSFVIIVDSR